MNNGDIVRRSITKRLTVHKDYVIAIIKDNVGVGWCAVHVRGERVLLKPRNVVEGRVTEYYSFVDDESFHEYYHNSVALHHIENFVDEKTMPMTPLDEDLFTL